MAKLTSANALAVLEALGVDIEKGAVEAPQAKYSRVALYLLSKQGYTGLTDSDGIEIAKSTIDETTLDFTRGRTLTEEQARIQLDFIFDKSPYLRMFNSRIVNKLVVPIQAKAIRKKNLFSRERNGGTSGLTINKRIVHNFGLNLQLQNIQLDHDIPLQTVIDNLWIPSWDAEVQNDVAISLSNDILLLVTNGLETGTYSSTQEFYDLCKGFIQILRVADGAHTNSYGSITVNGFLGKYLTPVKINTADYIGVNYTGANLQALMTKMHDGMLPEYRSNPNNVFMMSQADVDTYRNSRSIMTGSNAVATEYREGILTDGSVPRFLGKQIVVLPDMISINETHEVSAAISGAIVYGNPMNIDVASDSTSYLKTDEFNGRGSTGSVFEYTYNMYMDVQVGMHESFVIAFNGATVQQIYMVNAVNYPNGISDRYAVTSGANYAVEQTTFDLYPVCDTQHSEIYYHTSTLSATKATAISAGATRVQDGDNLTDLANDVYYIRAYYDNAVTSPEITLTVTTA